MVHDGGVDRGEFLQTSHAPEPLHRPFPSSERKVGILRPVVQMPARPLPSARAQIPQRGPVGRQLVCHNLLRPAMPPHGFPEEFQRRLLVTGLCHKAFQHFALVIHRPPQIMPLAVDLHENLIKVPSPAARPHTRNPALADLSSKHRAKAPPPVPNRLMSDIDATLMEQVFDVPQREWKPDVHHHRKADDLRARLEVAKRAAFSHAQTLRATSWSSKTDSSDRTNETLLNKVIYTHWKLVLCASTRLPKPFLGQQLTW